jgi:copper chaperone
MERMTMNIGGMSCGHCVSQVADALGSLDGVEVEQVTVGTATVSYDSTATSAAEIAHAVEDRGYSVVSTAG